MCAAKGDHRNAFCCPLVHTVEETDCESSDKKTLTCDDMTAVEFVSRSTINDVQVMCQHKQVLIVDAVAHHVEQFRGRHVSKLIRHRR